MNTEKQLQFVTYEQAKALEELGFDWECDRCYLNKQADGIALNVVMKNHNNGSGFQYSAPTVALALEYCRDVKGVIGLINGVIQGEDHWFIPVVCYGYEKGWVDVGEDKYSYKAAESALLDEIINYLKSQEQ